MKRTILAACTAALLAIAFAAQAKPVANVSARRHPNIAAAQKLTDQAFERITAAQKANEYDMEGHAQKAKQLLESASAELKLAAEAANRNK